MKIVSIRSLEVITSTINHLKLNLDKNGLNSLSARDCFVAYKCDINTVNIRTEQCEIQRSHLRRSLVFIFSTRPLMRHTRQTTTIRIAELSCNMHTAGDAHCNISLLIFTIKWLITFQNTIKYMKLVEDTAWGYVLYLLNNTVIFFDISWNVSGQKIRNILQRFIQRYTKPESNRTFNSNTPTS